MMLRRACSENSCSWEREPEDLDCRGTYTGATAKNEDGFRLTSGGRAIWEEGEGDLQSGVDNSCGSAVTDSEIIYK